MREGPFGMRAGGAEARIAEPVTHPQADEPGSRGARLAAMGIVDQRRRPHEGGILMNPRRLSRSKAVPRGGIEPPTRGFSVPCSTN